MVTKYRKQLSERNKVFELIEKESQKRQEERLNNPNKQEIININFEDEEEMK